MKEIVFKHVSYNRLKAYISSRMMYFNCRVNLWEDLVLTVGIEYNGFLCGGVLITRIGNDCKVECWYSRDDRSKMELLEYVLDLLYKLNYDRVIMRPQKKWIAKLLELGWKQNDKVMYKCLKENDNG